MPKNVVPAIPSTKNKNTTPNCFISPFCTAGFKYDNPSSFKYKTLKRNSFQSCIMPTAHGDSSLLRLKIQIQSCVNEMTKVFLSGYLDVEIMRLKFDNI